MENNILANANGTDYYIIANDGNNYLVKNASGYVTLAFNYNVEKREWAYSEPLGTGNEAIAIGMVMLTLKGEHNKDFTRNIFNEFSYEEKFDAVMTSEKESYRNLPEAKKADVYEKYMNNDYYTGYINSEFLDDYIVAHVKNSLKFSFSTVRDEEMEF